MAEIIDDRLDAERYAPEQIENLKQLRSIGARPLGEIVDNKRSNYGVLPPSPEYVSADEGIGLIRGGDLDHGHVSEPSVWAPRSYLNLRGQLHADDVLILAKGACIDGPSGVGLVTLAKAGLIFNGTSYRVRVAKGDPAFLVAYCMTHALLLQKRREISNTGVSYNSEDAIRAFLVPNPDIRAQHYIGSKVRQAEALREWGRSTEARFRDAVALDVPDATGRGRQSRISSSDLDLDLNPGRFTPDRLEVRRTLSRSGARLVESFATIAADNVASPATHARYLGLDGISTSSIDITLQRFSEAGVSGICRALPRGAAISKLRPYLNKAVFIPGGLGQVVGSTELLCLRSEAVHPGYLYGVLKLDTTVRQLNPVASGATHPRIGPDEVLDVLVPWRTDHAALGQNLERAQLAYFGARSLVTAARLLVEALIERKVTEAELIDAGKNIDADRALLARLAEDGIDGAGAPLFSDLDTLADLIIEVSTD